jgi:hypothetical protein
MVNLFKALLKAQKSMGAATKDAANPFFKSKYADYGAVLEAVKGPLNDNGVVLLQPHIFQEGKTFVKTVLVHAETGESYESLTEVVCAKQNDPQAMGSAITYARRYGLQSLPCLPTEDDDGNAASGKAKTVTSQGVTGTTSITSQGTSGAITVTNATPVQATPARSGFRRVGAAASTPTPAPATNSDDGMF